TSRAASAKKKIVALLENEKVAEYTRHVGEVASLAPLLSISKVVAFPVDDLYGKVDLPLVLLEALALGIPLVLARGGPLEEIQAARYVPPKDAAALATEISQLLESPGDLPHKARSRYLQAYRPGVIAAAYDDLYDALR
ncbi:MAG: glycosyltransferase, partial [Polyangiaceae bacterium]